MKSDLLKQDKSNTYWKNADIPIVIGVSAHRNIDKRYSDDIKKQVGNFLDDIISMCPNSSIYMLSGLAQGGDLLCARVAIEKGIKIIAALPFETLDDTPYDNEYDFDDKDDLKTYRELISSEHVVKQFIVPDTEKIPHPNDLKKLRKYLFRQQSIYVATNSHILLSLWDGAAPDNSRLECGTNIAVHFALEHNFYRPNGMEFFSSYDGTVVGIFSPRQGKTYLKFSIDDFEYKYIVMDRCLKNKDVIIDSIFTRMDDSFNFVTTKKMPQYIKDTLVRTDTYNEDYLKYCKSLEREKKKTKENKRYLVNQDIYDSNEEAKPIHNCYRISSIMSASNKRKYLLGIKLLSIFGVLLILSWMLYDQIAYRWTSILCAVMLLMLLIGYVIVNFTEATKIAVKIKLKKKFDAHTKFIEYRALSETLRVQYYLLSLGVLDNTSSLFTWAHKSDMTWVKMAVTVLLIGISENEWQSDLEHDVIEKWIGKDKTKSESENGQMGYHLRNSVIQRNKIRHRNITNSIILTLTIVTYIVLFISEIFSAIDLNKTMFSVVTVRIFLKCCLSVFAAVTFFVSYNYSKLSLDQNIRDSIHMANLYSVALDRIDAIQDIYKDDETMRISEMKSLVRELAHNQLVENGTWVAYNRDNGNDVPI